VLIFKRKFRRLKVKSQNSRIMRNLEFNENVLFKNFTRMSKTKFYTLLGIVEPMITEQKTRFRESVPVEIKLVITLRYLATRYSFMSLVYLLKVSKKFISSMLPGVRKTIPYFSIDNAHLMYNGHPKLFRHSF